MASAGTTSRCTTPEDDPGRRVPPFPELQVITGHWGRSSGLHLDRIDQLLTTTKLPATLDYVRDNLLVTPSGVLSHRYLRWAVEVIGPSRILFATDYPFVPLPTGSSRRFLEEADLTETERAMIGSANWERIRSAIRR